MPTTTVFKIPYPDGTSILTPLASRFADIANGVESALLTGLGGAPRLAHSDSERDSLIPSPTQGDSVERPDKGWIEQYYALYDASTNPSGAVAAGWYPIAGSMPYLFAKRDALAVASGSASQTFINTKVSSLGGVSIGTDGYVTVTQPGVYMIVLTADWSANGTGQRNLGVDGVTVLGKDVVYMASNASFGVSEVLTTHVRVDVAAGRVRPYLVHNSGAALTVTGHLDMRYVGPATAMTS